MASTIDLFQAWKLWAENVDIHDETLWFLTIRSWGRAGIIMQFLATGTLVLEILGPERVRSFGTVMSERLHSLSIGNFFERIGSFRRSVILFTEENKSVFIIIGFIIAVIIISSILQYRIDQMSSLQKILFLIVFFVAMTVAGLTIGGIMGVCIGALFLCILFSFGIWALAAGFLFYGAVYVVSILFILPAYMFYATIIRPLSWLTSNKHLEHASKIVSLILIVFGFHFSLLAS